MAIDSMGTWSQSTLTYFEAAARDYERLNRMKAGQIVQETRVNVSIAVCKANELYLRY